MFYTNFVDLLSCAQLKQPQEVDYSQISECRQISDHDQHSFKSCRAKGFQIFHRRETTEIQTNFVHELRNSEGLLNGRGSTCRLKCYYFVGGRLTFSILCR